MPSDRTLIELTIAAPADTVWRSLRDPALIARWFGWDADTLADEIEFIFVTHADASDPDRIIRFTGTSDRFEVEAKGDETVLRVVRAGVADDSWDNVYEDMTEGWISFVEQLRLALERHAGEERRTLYFSGSAPQPGPEAATALGLDGLRAIADGAAFAATLDTGDRVEGEGWHRTPFQLATTVTSWGEGLLVVLDRPPSADHPGGAASATLTTYGLSDAAFDDLNSRWSAWWRERYPAKAPSCESEALP